VARPSCWAIVAHTSCLSSHWHALCRAVTRTGSDRASGFTSPRGCASQPARKLLSSPFPTSSQNPSSRTCPSTSSRALPLFLRQMAGATWRVANCFLLMMHAVRGGEAPHGPAQGDDRPRPCSPAPWTQGHPAYVHRKLRSFRTEGPCNLFELDLEKL